MSKCLYCQTELPEGYGMVCSSCEKDLSNHCFIDKDQFLNESVDDRLRMNQNENRNSFPGIKCDISNIPDQTVEVVVGIEPKIKCKSKIMQSLLVKLFGYKTITKKVQAKVVAFHPDDLPAAYVSKDISFDWYSEN